jgi:dTDP-4-dehydrorhamnose reductase
MKPKILLIGKGGQIGSELAVRLPRVGDVVAVDRSQLDLSKPEDIRGVIRTVRPRLIVNAAAYTAVDQAEKEQDLARSVNTDAPEIMAQEGKKFGASLVHYSTDYVFDGTKSSAYSEDDPPNPLSVYGRTKLAGEQVIQSIGVPHLILRTAWVYATRGRNFLLTILRLAAQLDELRVVRDQFGAPTCNVDIAKATVEILTQLSRDLSNPFDLSNVGGTYNITAGGVTTWYDFAVSLLDMASKATADLPWLTNHLSGLPPRDVRVIPITTAEYPTPARRPSYSVLSNSRLTSTFGIKQLDWQVQLRRIFEDKFQPSIAGNLNGPS